MTPYKDNKSLPKGAKKYSSKAQSTFRKTFNAVLDKTGDEKEAFGTAYKQEKRTGRKKK